MQTVEETVIPQTTQKNISQPVRRRIPWVDTAKGIAIFFVIAGHTRLPIWMVWYIFSFHVPLFFFLAGFLFSIDRYTGFSTFFWKRVRRLLVPYLIFSLISIGPFYWDTMHAPHAILPSAATIINGLFFLNGYILWDIPIWFLPCLFVIEIAYYWMRRLTKGRQGLLIILLGLLAWSGFAFAWMTIDRIPFGIDIALIAISFYGAGNLLKNVSFEMPRGIRGVLLVILAFVANVLIVMLQSTHTDLYKLHMDHPVLFFAGAVAGIATWLMVSMLIQRSRFFNYLGRNTLAILVTHIYILWMLEQIAHVYFNYFPEITDGSGFIMTPLILVGLLPVVYVLNRYFPELIGKQRPAATLTNERAISKGQPPI